MGFGWFVVGEAGSYGIKGHYTRRSGLESFDFTGVEILLKCSGMVVVQTLTRSLLVAI